MRRLFIRFSAAVALIIAEPVSTHAQLRPLEPAAWDAFAANTNIVLTGGFGVLAHQPLMLAGTVGRLTEIGNYSITWRSGRTALTASGTALWKMSDESVRPSKDPPLPGIGSDHSDAGPVVIENATRLSPDNARLLWLLRFGARLPITSFESGLDRDETDFFVLFGLRTKGDLWFAGEAGAALNGKPEPHTGQTDVFVYIVGSGYTSAQFPIVADAWVVANDDLHDGDARGNENLKEMRIGVRNRGPLWLKAQWIHGFSKWGPSNGLRITAGLDWAPPHSRPK